MSKLVVGSLLYGCVDIAYASVKSILESNLHEDTTFYLLDNGSPNTDEVGGILEYAQRAKKIGGLSGNKHVDVCVNPRNLGFSGGVNQILRKGFEDPECQWVVVVAQDTILHPDCIQNLVKRTKKGGVHLVTASCVPYGKPMPEPREGEGVGALFMGCFLTTRQLYNDVGEWDEKFFPAYFEDNDYHARVVKAGYHQAAIGLCSAVTQHRRSSTIKKYPQLNARFVKNRQYYCEKWGGMPAEVMPKLVEKYGGGVPRVRVEKITETIEK